MGPEYVWYWKFTIFASDVVFLFFEIRNWQVTFLNFVLHPNKGDQSLGVHTTYCVLGIIDDVYI